MMFLDVYIFSHRQLYYISYEHENRTTGHRFAYPLLNLFLRLYVLLHGVASTINQKTILVIVFNSLYFSSKSTYHCKELSNLFKLFFFVHRLYVKFCW